MIWTPSLVQTVLPPTVVPLEELASGISNTETAIKPTPINRPLHPVIDARR